MANAKEEYNKIAEGYSQATIRPMRKLAYEPTIKQAIGSLKGKKVLDLACGEGVSSRMMKELGAKEVVGLDVSEALIQKANETGGEGIKYLVKDCIKEDISNLGKFDVVTAIMFLHYAKSKDQLRNVIKNIKKTLISGGIFCTLTVNPETLKSGYKNYGIKLSKVKKEGDSVIVELNDFNWNKFCEFTIFYWDKETYTKILEEEGFIVEWLPGIVSNSGLDEYGEEFWKTYLENPPYSMIKATLNK